MSVFYKIQGYSLSTSSLTTVLNINTSSVAIVKEITVANNTGAQISVDFYVRDYSAGISYLFYHTIVPTNSTDNAVNNTLILEEGDSLKFQAANGDAISGQISYALINRVQQNG